MHIHVNWGSERIKVCDKLHIPMGPTCIGNGMNKTDSPYAPIFLIFFFFQNLTLYHFFVPSYENNFF